MSQTNGINGIPVKVKVSATDFETIYLSTFRKTPKLKKMSKEFVVFTLDLEKYSKLENCYSQKLTALNPFEVDNFEEEIERLSKKSKEMIDKIDEVSENIIKLSKEYIITSLKGAGYTVELAKEKAELIPEERFSDILEATRTGATKVLDFFTDNPPQEQS